MFFSFSVCYLFEVRSSVVKTIMATGGPLDDPNVDRESLTERDIELMATLLRETGKFHVVPLYEQQHELSYEEEQEETNISSSLRASHTPRSFEDHSKAYRPVRPPTPTPTRSPGPRLADHRQPLRPYLTPIKEEFSPRNPIPGPPRGINPHTLFEQGKMMGKGQGSLSDKGIPSLFEEIRGPSRTFRPPTEQGGTLHAITVSVKQEENVRPKATYIPSFPSQPLHRGTSQ